MNAFVQAYMEAAVTGSFRSLVKLGAAAKAIGFVSAKESF